VPANTTVSQFTIEFSTIDDGGRVTIFNANYPNGIIIPGSYVTLSNGGTADLATYITSGQNRVVVTQVDDCPTGNNLNSAIVVLNGTTVETCSIGEEQTFTILGANGTVGDIDPYSQSLPAGATEWQPAYLSGGHPWGLIPGTNSWVNYSPNNAVGINTRTPYRIRFEVPEDFTDPSMVFQLKADNRAVIWINNTFIDSVDGGGTVSPADAVVSSALHPGVNEIRLLMVDWGGIVGFNYRIDVTMTSCEDITDAVLTPGEAAALNNAPLADAGPDQASETASVVLDGSGSSDPDENILIYSWSENGSEIATGINPTITLADGLHAITLTVSDGELSATDDVIVNVQTNVVPVADAGADFNTVTSIGQTTQVVLDGSASSDPDNDVLSYSWSGTFGTATGVSPSISLGAGTHTITLTVDDGNGGSASDDVVVTVTPVDFPLTDGLVGYWPADGDAGDATGNANGTLGSTTTFECGINGDAFSFNGAQSSLVTVPVNIGASAYPEMTMGMFVKLRSQANTQGWVMGHDNGGFDRSLILHDSRYNNGLAAGVGHSYSSTLPKLKDDLYQWYFIATAYDAPSGTAMVYANDLSGSSVVQVINASNTEGLSSFTLGGLEVAVNNHTVDALVDEVFIFDRTLTQAELDQLCTDLNQNPAPIAAAGADQSFECVLGAVDVTLDGSSSSDPGCDVLTYSWSLAGTEVATTASFNTSLMAGTYDYTLTVNDGVQSISDAVSVTVVADTEAPSITLLGSGPFGVNIHGTWTDPGYETADACNSAVTVVLIGTVDTETPGDYILTYTATDESGNEAVAERTVTVINAAPIAVAGDDQGFDCVVGTVDVDLDGSGSSDADGDALTYSWVLSGTEVATTASLSATHSAGTYSYTLTVSDDFDSSSDDVVVTVIDDTEPPVITLLGDNPLNLGLYLEYVEPGASAEDVCEGEIIPVVTGSIDINTPGSYTLTYTATDAGGNASSADRIVEVVNTAPTVVNAVTEVVLSFGDALLSLDIDLATVFADVDVNDVLSYSFTSSNAAIADVSLSGSILSISALDLGGSNVSISATDPWGAYVTSYFSIVVNVTSTLGDALLFAQSEIKIKKDVEVYSGNLLVNEGSSHGNHHDDDEDDDDEDDDHGNGHNDNGDDHGRYQLSMDKDSHVAPGYALMADRIDIKQNTLVESDVYANDLNNRGDITGDIFGALVTPLFTTLPPFKSGAAGSQNITVNKNQSLELEAGDYGRIYVKERGTLTFTGGIYNIEKLEAKKNSHIRFEEATEVRVEDEVKVAKNSYVGPAGGSYIGASDIIFYIADDHHHAAKLEEDVFFFGTIYAQEGEVELEKDVAFTGAILAEKISIDKDCELTLDGYFSNGSGGGISKSAGRIAWVEPEMELELPLASGLSSNYPNPFNPSTTIDFALSQAGQVSLKIYDIRGAQVAEIARGYHEAGYYSVQFNPENISSGTYIYVLDAGSFREVKRMVYLK